MWSGKFSQTGTCIALFCASLFLFTDAFLTQYGRQKLLARHRRAATRWSQPVYSPAGYGGASYPQSTNIPTNNPPNYGQSQLGAGRSQAAGSTYNARPAAASYNQQYSSYPTNAATFQQYVTQPKNTAYSTAGLPSYSNYGAANQNLGGAGAYPQYAGQQQYPAGFPNQGAAAAKMPYFNQQMPQGPMPGMPGPAGFNPQMGASMFNPSMFNAKSNPQMPQNQALNAYPSVQSTYAKSQYAQPGSQQYVQQDYGLYQDPLRTPMQYNFNGFNPYGQQQQGNNNAQGGFNGPLQGIGRAASSQPLVTPAPQQTAQQYDLAQFCVKPDREPKCKKNAFYMCDYQDNYPTEAATEFYAYYKSRITAMTTDYDYSNSDQYDTGFATQQNKLIDFVHDIFDDNEYGSLPGVPSQKKGLCVGVSDIIQPGWAKTAHGKYYVIMNSNNIKQTVRAEVCKNVGKGCQTVPKCYKSECRQRYRYDTLLALDPCDPKRAPMLELFKIPDGCECIVVVDEPEVASDAATSAPTKQRNVIPAALARAADFPPATTTISPSTTTLSTAGSTSAPLTTTARTTQSTQTVPSTTTTTESTTTSTIPTTSTETTSKQSLILSPR